MKCYTEELESDILKKQESKATELN